MQIKNGTMCHNDDEEYENANRRRSGGKLVTVRRNQRAKEKERAQQKSETGLFHRKDGKHGVVLSC